VSISENEVHLWYAHSDDALAGESRELAEAFLSPEERLRYESFYFLKDKSLFLLGRYLLRSLLSHYDSSVKPHEWSFNTSKSGKPFLKLSEGTGRNIYFNLAHSEGIVVCGFSANLEIGVDVESTERRIDILDFAQNNFSREEIQFLEKLPHSDQKKYFFKIWTLKESYIKSRGMGLRAPLDQFSFKCDSSDHVSVRFSEQMREISEDWNFELVLIEPKHQAAIAYPSGTKKTLIIQQPDLHLK
jgi:4'-phosphopantetheinyl transferase